MSKDLIKISVLDLVGFVLQSGDLGKGFAGGLRTSEAIKAHQAIQKSAGDEYSPEVTISYTIERQGITLEINGRIDGIIRAQEGITIDEIKTTTGDIESIDEDTNPLHFAQAKCYAYIHAVQNSLGNIDVQLTYFQIDTGETRRFIKSFSLKELEIFFYDLIDRYIKWALIIRNWNMKRDDSIKDMAFPFQSYRKGQRELAVSIYKVVKSGSKLFVQAPTGTGKTIAALFPAVKALGEGLCSKIFYLTARTTTRAIAETAIGKMRERGLFLKTLTITAKEKICFSPGCECSPEACSYARGYYDKVGPAVEDIFSHDSFTRDFIEDYAKKYDICPFEFSLDLSLWADCIICDYNYVFDPRAYLKRFFLDGGGDYCFLIDETHNLVDRCREMFSAELLKKDVLELKRTAKVESRELYKSLNDINSYMIKLRKACEENKQGCIVSREEPEEAYLLLNSFIKLSDEYLSKQSDSPLRQQLLEFYFNALFFIKISEYYDDKYYTYFEKYGNDIRLKMFCSDPSNIMKKLLKRGKSAVFFSATLTPMDYYMDMLGGGKESFKVRVPSPFLPGNLCIMVDNGISTRYSMREYTYEKVAVSITSLISGKAGNYMAYFPSYKYMDEVFTLFSEKNPHIRAICQKHAMTEMERDEFLQQFSESSSGTLIGFAVMGGVFSEGIDLAGDRLSGAVIVGVGLPQICLERDIIRDYFNEVKGAGFEYSYIYPGMGKVLQAAGRVIRTESDRGVVLLIDERFSHSVYREIFPPEWRPEAVRDSNHIKRIVGSFWNEGNAQQ